MWKLIAVLVVLMLGGCAAPPRTFAAEPGLEDLTREAVASWNRAIPCSLDLEYVTDHAEADVVVQWRVVPERKPDATVYGEGGIKGNEIGPWGTFESWVYIDPETTPDRLPTVVAHEIGHALRAPHSDNDRDLMYAHYHPGMTSTANARDGRSVCDVWGM